LEPDGFSLQCSTFSLAFLTTNEFLAGTRVPVSEFSLPQSVADRIGKAVLAKFSELMSGQAQHSRRKVLAGIVMTRDESMEELTVISMATGTKCINGEHMSVSGSAINGKVEVRSFKD